MRLRDHDQPCEHDDDAFQWKQRLGVEGPLHWDCHQGGCPGGRDITIDYEAAEAMLRDRTDDTFLTVKDLVDAATGPTE